MAAAVTGATSGLTGTATGVTSGATATLGAGGCVSAVCPASLALKYAQWKLKREEAKRLKAAQQFKDSAAATVDGTAGTAQQAVGSLTNTAGGTVGAATSTVNTAAGDLATTTGNLGTQETGAVGDVTSLVQNSLSTGAVTGIVPIGPPLSGTNPLGGDGAADSKPLPGGLAAGGTAGVSDRATGLNHSVAPPTAGLTGSMTDSQPTDKDGIFGHSHHGTNTSGAAPGVVGSTGHHHTPLAGLTGETGHQHHHPASNAAAGIAEATGHHHHSAGTPGIVGTTPSTTMRARSATGSLVGRTKASVMAGLQRYMPRRRATTAETGTSPVLRS